MSLQIADFRLSPQQRRLWLSPEAEVLRAQCAILLEGPLDSRELKTVLQQVVDQHGIFRTAFHRVPNMRIPVQFVAADVSASWTEIDLAGQEEKERFEEIYAADKSRPFDLERGPLLHATLLRLSAQRHLLLLVVPSLCADAATLKNLFVALSHRYGAGLMGNASAAEPAQYGEFSDWQNQILEDEDSDAGKDYWRRQSVSDWPTLKLPSETNSDSCIAQGFRRGSVSVKITSALVNRLHQTAQQQEVSAADLLLATWMTLLQRLTQSTEVAVAYVANGRKYEEMYDAMGPFARSLPVRCNLAVNVPFGETLHSVSQAVREAHDWQEYFTWDELEVGKHLSDSVIGFEFEPRAGRTEAGGVTFSIVEQAVSGEPFKLKLSCIEADSELTAEFDYDENAFAAASIERLGQQFVRLLEGVIDAPHTSLDELEMLAPDELRQLLREWNCTEKEYTPQLCVQELFEIQAAATPDEIAVSLGEEQLSYRELDKRANQLAQYLSKLGIGPDALVGICLERSLEMVVALLGVLKAGAAYLPLEPSSPPTRLAYMIGDAKLGAVLTEERLLEKLPPNGPQTICLDTAQELISSQAGARFDSGVGAQNLAYVIYTSGSTGRPKGVMIPHGGLANYLLWSREAYRVADGQGAPVHSPLSFDLTITSLLLPLITGRSVRLIEESEGVEGLIDALDEQIDFSLVKITPAHLEVLSQGLATRSHVRHPRALVIGGEALFGERLAFWRRHAPNTRIVNEYGPTETVVGCCVYEFAAGADISGPVPIGRPIANAQMYVLDRHLRPAPVGVAGELYIGGNGLARGYLGRPELTADKFVPHPFSDQPGLRLYATGDRVRYLQDGNLEFLGRNDAQTKIRGYRIELEEIEAVLDEHSAVRQTVVVAREETDGDRRLVAYLVPETGESPTVDELREFLQQRLPEYMLPSAFVLLDALPLTANGKVNRAALPAPDHVRPELARAFVAPSTAVEKKLAEIWSEVLGIDQIGIHDSFFALGGDSIRSVRVVALAKRDGLIFTVQQLFQSQTISLLAEGIERAAAAEPGEAGSVIRTAPFSLLSEEDRLNLPAGVIDAYPLTMLQMGMLYHMEATPGAPQYHNVNSFRLRFRLEPETFQEAVDIVVNRHDNLRTSFDLTSYSEPTQLVHSEAHLPVQVEDWRHLTPAEQERAFTEFLRVENDSVLDITQAPLLRYHLHRYTDDTCSLTLTEPHSISDGWSTTSLLAEIFEIYFALLNHEPLPVEEPVTLSYSDFVLLERQAVESAESQQYWQRTLADCVVMEVPRLSTSIRNERKRELRYHNSVFPAALFQGLKDLAARLEVPLKTLLLAAHMRAMSLISGQQDVLTGLVCNGRPEELDGERIHGLFLNTLPFRQQVAGGSWKDLIKETYRGEAEMLPFRRYPGAEVQKLWGRQPLFEVAFTYLHFHSVDRLLLSGQLEYLGGLDLSGTNYTLQVIFDIKPGLAPELRLLTEYEAAKLSEEQMDALHGYLHRALEAMVNDVDARYEAESLLSTTERAQLAAWNSTEHAYARDKFIHQLFEEQAAQKPDAIALTFAAEQLSYRELNARANQLAHRLQSLGIGPESLVGVLMERSLEMVVALLAILKAGAAYVPLDPAYPQERLTFMFGDAGLSLVLTQANLREKLAAHGPDVLSVDTEWESIAGHSDANPNLTLRGDNLAYAIYTSGSTGKPKGAMNSHAAILNRLLWMQDAFQLDASDVVLQKTPFSFDVSVWEFFWPLMCGARLVLALPDGHRDPAYLAQTIRAEGVTTLHFVSSMLAVFLEEQTVGESCGSLRRVICSGEALSAELQRRFYNKLEAELHNLYGPTEAAVDVTWWACERDSDRASVPIGRPIRNLEVYVLDGEMGLVPVGVPGELHLGGVGLARGYLHRPELTAERFIPHPYSQSGGARLYKTGDLGRYLPDGEIEFLGRLDHQVKMRGYRIELGEIEAVLAEQEGVREVLVQVREDVPGDPRLVAYVVGGAEEGSWEEWRQYLRERLPEYMIPSAFVRLKELPLTANGKVNRQALPAPDKQRPELAAEYLAPVSQLEREIAGVWAEVLQVERVGREDNFFDLGGHSLLMLQVNSRLKEMLGREVGMMELFQHPTVSAQAKYLSQTETAPPSFQDSLAKAETRRTSLSADMQSRKARRMAARQSEKPA